ncbi:hypothetical protein L2E82_29098 [Cichorium intybus]|uniref:Uncharacterized protein n=1 Tax=Cichorium intybus TaxID=13427 RepID=A0ACB9CX48_CICIN|nr:hypothetical protein L2E82_29098 [Cichorium intybus]
MLIGYAVAIDPGPTISTACGCACRPRKQHGNLKSVHHRLPYAKSPKFLNRSYRMTLTSRSELQREPSKTMDLMDVNQVLEVPDTPDRLVASTHDSVNKNIETQINASMNNRRTGKDYNNVRIRNQQREKGKSVTINGNRRLFIHPDSSSSFKHPRPLVDITKHDKGKALLNSDVPKFTYQEGGQNGHRVNESRKGVLSLNRALTTDSLDRSSKSCKVNTNSEFKKGVDFLDTVNHKAESNAPQKKMLVRNGCISPNNIAKSKPVSKNQETGSVVKEVQSGSSTVNIKDIITEDKDSHRSKGKGVFLHHHSSSKEPSYESERWRTTHNHRKQRDIEEKKKGVIQKDNKNEKDFVNLDESKIVPSRNLLGVNRQKEGTSTSTTPSRNLGKRCVSFVVDDSIEETSTSRSKRIKNHSGVGPSNPVIEPVICKNEDSSVRDFQVEADEMLARELQEQLYNEELTPVVDVDEMDSHLAFAMPAQRDNSSRRRLAPSSLIARERVQPNTSRRSSVQRVLQPQPRTTTRMSQLRTRFRSRPQTVLSNSNRRNSMFPPNMDVDMRMQILETLEAVGDMRRPNDLQRIGREFNEGDYEMLLALDDDNHRHGGATRAQINNLPESKVQAENLQECSICLETPTIGETIRHLPCLHRFHKACIDPWLRRKTSCPVCKSSIR